MKVALLSHEFAEYCIQLANGLARECEVLLLLPRADAEPHAGLLDPAVRFFPFEKPRLRQAARQLLSTTSIVRQIRRFSPDVFHLQHGHMWFNLAIPWLQSYPMVTTIHDPRHHVGDYDSSRVPQSLLNFGYRRADRVIVHGEILKRQVVDALRIPADRVHVTPHVAIGKVEKRPVTHDDDCTLLFFGRIWKYKGLEHLIRAQPAITAAFPKARFVIAGEGEDFQPYREMMVDADRFEVHNRYISAAERDQLFQQASIVMLPYIEATQSGVIPVAYSFAKPVIATDTGALSEAVDHGLTGLLVPPADATALAEAAISLLAAPARRRQMGEAGRRKLEQQCAPHRVAMQTIEVYRRAIRDRSRAASVPAPPQRAGEVVSALSKKVV